MPFQATKPGEHYVIGPFDITATYAYNIPEGNSTRKPHKRGQCVGYVVKVTGKRIYHVGDTDAISEMFDLGCLDVALLPVDGTFTIDLGEAINCAEAMNPALFIPMHFLHVTREQTGDALRQTSLTYALPQIGEKLYI